MSGRLQAKACTVCNVGGKFKVTNANVAGLLLEKNMDFEDSFFDSDSEQEERKSKTKQKDKVVYNARICEIGVNLYAVVYFVHD